MLQITWFVFFLERFRGCKLIPTSVLICWLDSVTATAWEAFAPFLPPPAHGPQLRSVPVGRKRVEQDLRGVPPPRGLLIQRGIQDIGLRGEARGVGARGGELVKYLMETHTFLKDSYGLQYVLEQKCR